MQEEAGAHLQKEGDAKSSRIEGLTMQLQQMEASNEEQAQNFRKEISTLQAANSSKVQRVC